MRAYLGIDPGKTGALALYSADTVDTWDYDPGLIDVLRVISDENTICLAAVEHVGAMPGQGVTSMFSFGQNFGWWIGVLETLRIPFVLVRPQKWQRELSVPPKSDKADKPSLEIARRLFPSEDLRRKKDHGRADALLLAYWASKQGAT